MQIALLAAMLATTQFDLPKQIDFLFIDARTGEELARTAGFSFQYLPGSPLKINGKAWRIYGRCRVFAKNTEEVRVYCRKRWLFRYRDGAVLNPVNKGMEIK